MSFKSVAGTLAGFLSHHVADLDALDTALSSILAAVPVNSGTRATVQDAIDRIKDSAVNIGNAVAAFTSTIGDDDDASTGAPAVIRESDIEAALAKILPGAIEAYVAAHGGPSAPVVGDNADLAHASDTAKASPTEGGAFGGAAPGETSGVGASTGGDA